MKARAELMLAVHERVKAWAVPQEEAARRPGLTRPRPNDLLRGKIDKFSLDALVNIATAAGYALHIKLEAAHRGPRRSGRGCRFERGDG